MRWQGRLTSLECVRDDAEDGVQFKPDDWKTARWEAMFGVEEHEDWACGEPRDHRPRGIWS